MSSKFIVKSHFLEKFIFCEKIIVNFEKFLSKIENFQKMRFFEQFQTYRSQRIFVFIFRLIVHLTALDEYFLDMIKFNNRPHPPLVSATIEEGSFLEFKIHVFRKFQFLRRSMFFHISAQ